MPRGDLSLSFTGLDVLPRGPFSFFSTSSPTFRMGVALLTHHVGLQKPLDSFHPLKKSLYEAKAALIFHPGMFPVLLRAAGRPEQGGEGWP